MFIARWYKTIFLIALLLVSLSLIPNSSPGSDPGAAGGLPAKLDAYLRPFVETENFSGVVFVVRNDSVLYQKGFGMANYEFGIPNAPDTRFHVASISKAFTAAAVLLLEERGKLSVSDSVSRFFPDYPGGGRIRVEDLLKHTSGIPNVNTFPEYARESLVPHTTAEVVGLFKDKPLDFQPGSRSRYSNSDYNLLALLIEKISGQTYGDFLNTNIFKPLGLASTFHDGDATKVIPRSASGTEPDGLRGIKHSPYLDWSIKVGNGSLVSTAGDLCRFARALFGRNLLGAESLARIMPSGPAFPYGWTSSERSGRNFKTAAGRSPGFVSSLEYCQDDGSCIAILSNSYSSVAQVIAPDISAIVHGQSPETVPVAFVPPGAGGLAPFKGRYLMPDNYFVPGATVKLIDRGEYLEGDWSGGDTTIIYPAGGDHFVDRTYWAYMRFTHDTHGDLTGFVYRLTQDFTAKKVAE